MSYPPNPEIDYSYADFQQEQQDFPFPGTQLDNDLANLVNAIDLLNAFVQGVTRSDGKLANQLVGVDQLSSALNVGFTLQGAWAAGVNYSTADGVAYNGNFYRAKFAHLSTNANRPDLGATTWQFLFAIASISGAMSAFVYDPTNKMADAFARANHTGVQAISTITNLQTALDAKADDTDLSNYLALAGGVMTGPIQDLVFAPSSAPTKKVALDATALTAGATRTLKMPDYDVDLGKLRGRLLVDVTLASAAAAISSGLLDTTTYNSFEFELRGAYPTSIGTLNARLSGDGGSTWLTSYTSAFVNAGIAANGPN